MALPFHQRCIREAILYAAFDTKRNSVAWTDDDDDERYWKTTVFAERDTHEHHLNAMIDRAFL